MDHTVQQSRGAQDDRPASSTITTQLEMDELRAQLAQALLSVTQLTQQNDLLLSQMNTPQRQIQEEREERIQMQQTQREMYRQSEARATDRSSPKRAREKEGGESRLQEANTTQSTGGTGSPGDQSEMCKGRAGPK
jgi:hypothetical protein